MGQGYDRVPVAEFLGGNRDVFPRPAWEQPAVASLLALRVFHVGGSVAVPQRCRLSHVGKGV